MRRRATAVGVAVAGLLLAGCGAGEPVAPSGTATAAAPPVAESAPPATTAPVPTVSADPRMEHIHNLALLDDGTLLLGSHDGLWRQEPGQAPVRVGEPFDVMGFALDGERWLASGHPAPGQAAHADLGLLESRDQGRTWTAVALAGQADFHRIAVGGTTVLGVDSGTGRLLRSVDGGSRWQALGPGPYDLALDPGDPAEVVATTPQGPVRSSDAGTTFAPAAGAPLLSLVSWTAAALYAVSPDGSVHSSTDAAGTWTRTGAVPGTPVALAAGASGVVVLAGGAVHQSTDGGVTFVPRVTGFPVG